MDELAGLERELFVPLRVILLGHALQGELLGPLLRLCVERIDRLKLLELWHTSHGENDVKEWKEAARGMDSDSLESLQRFYVLSSGLFSCIFPPGHTHITYIQLNFAMATIEGGDGLIYVRCPSRYLSSYLSPPPSCPLYFISCRLY